MELFVNTLSANDKYSRLNRDNLLQHLEMQLSQKQKNVFPIFISFWKSRFNFEDFQKKDDFHSRCSFELIDSEKDGEINV